jgi:hypothetical protein
VLDAPFGRAMLVAAGVGLAGYALWRLVASVADPEGKGSDAKGIARRIGDAGRGVIHGGLAYSAFRLAFGRGGGGQRAGGSDGADSERWTARALEAPGGEWLVWAAACGIVAYGLYQLYAAYRAKLSKQLDVGRLSAQVGRWVIGVSRLGIAARGGVFALVGTFLLRAAMRHDAEQAGGVGESLRAVARMGRWPLVVVALGLVAYGVYQLANAKYRRIRVE